MTSEEFIHRAKNLVANFAMANIEKKDGKPVKEFTVYVVWSCYILGNQKALLSTSICDGMYYEVTYNAQKDEIYFDAYKRWLNIRYPSGNEKEDAE